MPIQRGLQDKGLKDIPISSWLSENSSAVYKQAMIDKLKVYALPHLMDNWKLWKQTGYTLRRILCSLNSEFNLYSQL